MLRIPKLNPKVLTVESLSFKFVLDCALFCFSEKVFNFENEIGLNVINLIKAN